MASSASFPMIRASSGIVLIYFLISAKGRKPHKLSKVVNAICPKEKNYTHTHVYLSNRPQFRWVYRRDKPCGMLGEHAFGS